MTNREAAIEWFSMLKEKFIKTEYEGYLDMAIAALEKQEKAYGEWCLDCKEYDHEHHCCPRWNRVIRETLKDAQPEIIRCKDCKHMITHEGYGYLGEPAYTCEGNMEGWVLPNGFCSHAERKDGETDG